MKTRRVLSNISFNTLDYFELCINDLVTDGVIDWAYWIQHNADTDDKKEHIHFCFQPSRSIDTIAFNNNFLQFPFHGDNRKALRPTFKYLPVISLDDWLLYCKHDEDYLLMKGLQRTYHYTWSDFGCTDNLAFEHDIGNIDKTKYGRLSILRDGVRMGTAFAELIQSGALPIAYRAQYQAQYDALKRLQNRERFKESERILGEMVDFD